MSLLGIDIGSSSCKGVVFDYNGSVLAQASKGYSTYSFAPDMIEIDAEIFWDSVVRITRQLVEMTENNKIEAISISSHGETFIPVDKNGRAVACAIMNSDNRAVKQAKWWEANLGRNKVYQITGLPLHPMFAINKIMWLKENKPELFMKTDWFLSVGDYILVRMGLPPYTDYSMASRFMAFDIGSKKWSEELLCLAGVNEDKLPVAVPAGTIAGKISSAAATELGLREGIIVAVGGHDQPCGALGAGVINPGEVSDSAGTYECLTAVSNKPCNTSDALTYNLNSYCHVVPERYVTLAFFPAGIVSKWFVDQFCFEDKMQAQQLNKRIFEVLDTNMEKICSGPTGLCITPHFIGSCNPYWDVNATGAIVGLTPQISRHHMYKAIYEGIACELAINVEALEKITGEFDSIKINGGNAKSSFTIQLRADLTGKQFYKLHTSEAVCHGAAMLAGIAAGIYKNTEDSVSKAVSISRTFVPNAEQREKYDKQTQQYKSVYPSLRKIY